MSALWNRCKRLAALENLLGILLGGTIVAVLFLVSASFRPGRNHRNETQLVSFDPPFIELGPALQDETLTYHLHLVNRSSDAMRILGLRASCNCTFINKDLTNTTIPPHGSISVPVQYRTGSAIGPVASTLEALIGSKDSRFYAQARLEGYIQPDFEFEPHSLNFGTLRPGEEATKTIRFAAGALKHLAISSPRSSQPEFTVTVRGSAAASAAQLPKMFITFKAPSNNCSQLLSGFVQADMSSKRVPHLVIPVSAQVIPELEITPDVIILPADAINQESRFTIRTVIPSRIVRVVAATDLGSHEIPTFAGGTNVPPAWGLSHVRRVSNAALAGAKQLNFELEVRKGTARVEARSVPVSIKSL